MGGKRVRMINGIVICCFCCFSGLLLIPVNQSATTTASSGDEGVVLSVGSQNTDGEKVSTVSRQYCVTDTNPQTTLHCENMLMKN